MVTPTKADIAKRAKKLQSFEKQLQPSGEVIDKKLVTILRSEIRKTWMKHPTKLAYLEKGIYPDMNPATRTKWLCDCEMCNNPTKLSDIEIDHIKGEHKFTEIDHTLLYARSILQVTFNDLQRLCSSCHATKTYAERYGLSMEDAKKEKKVIGWLKYPVTKQKDFLKTKGFSAQEISNEQKRRNCFRSLLT